MNYFHFAYLTYKYSIHLPILDGDRAGSNPDRLAISKQCHTLVSFPESRIPARYGIRTSEYCARILSALWSDSRRTTYDYPISHTCWWIETLGRVPQL